jgi:hypothetical protein
MGTVDIMYVPLLPGQNGRIGETEIFALLLGHERRAADRAGTKNPNQDRPSEEKHIPIILRDGHWHASPALKNGEAEAGRVASTSPPDRLELEPQRHRHLPRVQR